MLRFHPQLVPQPIFAVPLPLEFSVLVVKVKGALPSPHPDVCCTAVPEPEPDVLRLKVKYVVTKPHPVSPMKVAAHGPDKSALVTCRS